MKLPAKGYDGLFKIVFNYYNDSFRYPMNNSEIQVEEITSKQVGVPLNLILKDFSESNLELEFQYRISEFSENEIKIMCKCINNMLEQLVDNIYICVKDLKLVDRTEEKVLLKDFNVTDFPDNKATNYKGTI